MHPNSAFAWKDDAAMRAFAATHAFASIATVIDGRPATAWAPLSLGPADDFRFHLARANPVTPHLDGAPVVAGIVGTHFYVSPDWYGLTDQVPTWNYDLVEIEGIARRVTDAELAEQVDALSAAQEARLAPKPAWTSAKMDPARLAAMLGGITGFAIERAEVRGIRKFAQNKPEAARAAVAEALRALGDIRAAAAMSEGTR